MMKRETAEALLGVLAVMASIKLASGTDAPRFFADAEGEIGDGHKALTEAFIEAIERARREHPNR